MRKLLTALLSVAIISVPSVLRADSLTGQFSIQGPVTNTGTALEFTTVSTGVGTQTGSFATLLSDNESVVGNPILTYSPTYVPGSEILLVGPLSIDLETFAESSPGIFGGTALLSAAGFTDTDATVSLITLLNGNSVMFTATTTAVPPSVPEPSTLTLLGTGILGLTGIARRKFLLRS